MPNENREKKTSSHHLDLEAKVRMDDASKKLKELKGEKLFLFQFIAHLTCKYLSPIPNPETYTLAIECFLSGILTSTRLNGELNLTRKEFEEVVILYSKALGAKLVTINE